VKVKHKIQSRRPQKGVALLISIFVLMLVSVVAIAMIVSSGTESSLAGNYRSSTGVYYAALAGLEEARGRLLGTDPNALLTTDPGLLPVPGTPMPVGSPVYLINPNLAAGEVVAPWDLSSAYPDTQFGAEFSASGFAAPPNPSQSAVSVWDRAPLNGLPVPGPLFKWVRINAVSEKSLNLSVSPPGTPPSIGPLYYDGTHFSNNPAAGSQVLEVTALAALPNGSNGSSGSQKILQYLIAYGLNSTANLNLSFPAALTLDGNVDRFSSSFNSDFYVSGLDRARAASDQPNGTPCTIAEPPKPAIGALGTSSVNQVIIGIPPIAVPPYNRYLNYISTAPQPINPSIGDVTSALAPQLRSVSALDGTNGLVQAISAVADQPPIRGPVSSLPGYGTPSTPVTTVVNGDLTLSGGQVGYGLLVVTGDLTLGGNFSWHGVILVIGEGKLTISSYGYGKVDGAVLVAKTRADDGDLLSSLGDANFSVPDPNYGNSGIYYNSCWVNAATQVQAKGFKVLSFHEISQP
jgi:hypothetical protein